MLLALASRSAYPGGYQVQEITEEGVAHGPRRVVSTAFDLADWVPSEHRWLWDATASIYPALLTAGLRVERCHDITLSERILLGRDGSFGKPNSAAAIHARATGTTVPDDPVPQPDAGQPTLFDAGGPQGPEPPDDDSIELLRQALRDQRARIDRNRPLGLLLAAESASASPRRR